MQTNPYGKPIRDSRLLRRIKKARTRHQLLATHHSGYATLLQKLRHLSFYFSNTN
jgi:hypothetical protein